MENSTSEKLGLAPPKFNTKQHIQWGLASFGGAMIRWNLWFAFVDFLCRLFRPCWTLRLFSGYYEHSLRCLERF